MPSTQSSPVSRMAIPRALATTSTAPMRPKMAPDAPTVSESGA